MRNFMSLIYIKKLQTHKTIVSFLIISSIFGVFFTMSTPPLRGPDEMAHFSRAYQISEGVFLSERMKNEDNFGGSVPQSVLSIGQAAYDDLISVKRGGPNTLLSEGEWGKITSRSINSDQQELKFPGSASYPPSTYIAPALAVSAAKILDASAFTSLLLMRLACLIVFVALATLSLYIVREHKIKWLFFVVMLTPTAVFQASMISADGFMNALIFLLSALLIKSFIVSAPLSKIELYTFILATTLVALTKPNYAIFALTAILIPSTSFARITKIPPIAVKVLMVSIPLLALGVWSILTSDLKGYLGTVRGDGKADLINSSQQLLSVLNDPLNFIVIFAKTMIQNEGSYLLGVTNSVGGGMVVLPAFIVLVLLLFAGLYSKPWNFVYRQNLRFFGILLIALACSIFAALYLIYTPVSHGYIDGVQGRYFLPLLPGIVTALCSFLTIKIELRKNIENWLFPAGSTLALILVVMTS